MDLKHVKKTKLIDVDKIEIPDSFYRRIVSGIEKFDVLLGGSALPGALPGSSFTLTAPGGCGKTTLMFQWLDALVKAGYLGAIISGEESIFQLAYTAKRMNVKGVKVANMTYVEDVAKLAEEYDVVVVDSFQSMKSKDKDITGRELEKYIVETITSAGKIHECVFGFIMHHTKGGEMKGGTIIIHTVDANFAIEKIDDTEMRRIYCDEKNRFGAPGDFQAAMTATGYDFTVDAIETVAEERKRMGGASGSKGARRAEEILKLKEEGKKKGSLTLRDAAGIIGDMQRARFLMSDLHLQGVFKKTGRGDKAAFAYNPECEEQDAEQISATEEVQG